MLEKLVLHLENDGDDPIDYHIASALQGVLMEVLEPAYAAYLHTCQRHPYSLFVRKQGEEILWTVSALNREAAAHLTGRMKSEIGDRILVKQRQRQLMVTGMTEEKTAYEDLISQYYFQDQKRYLRIRFLTPTAFKTGGQYGIFPSARLIFQSLMMKYDACVGSSQMFDEDVLKHYEDYSQIVRYNLKSTFFSLEGVHIPSFMGEVTIKISGPQQLVNLAWLLAAFGEYSGVGIKTAMGMGAMAIVKGKE